MLCFYSTWLSYNTTQRLVTMPMETIQVQQKYSIQEACLKEPNRCHWRYGFIYPKCSQDKSCQLKHHYLHECAKRSCQISLTVGTISEHVRLSKWFVADYLIGTDTGDISTEKFSKMVSVTWTNACRMMMTLRQSVRGRNYGYWLDELVEVDEWLSKVHLTTSNFRSFLAGTSVAEPTIANRRWSCADSSFPYLHLEAYQLL